jgi:RNA recognition motif. (a.k.a. RRM, RBD, or RNP domain)
VNYPTFEDSTDSLEKLSPNVQNADLARLFKRISKVIKIDIRCSFGTGAVPSKDGTTVYATVLFSSVIAATHALAMNGRTLLGKKVVVSCRMIGFYHCHS